MSHIYGSGYSNTGGILFLLALTVLAGAISFPYSRGLFCLDRAKADCLINIASIAMILTVGVFAVRVYSAMGAAAVSLAGAVVTTVVRVLVLNMGMRRS